MCVCVKKNIYSLGLSKLFFNMIIRNFSIMDYNTTSDVFNIDNG